MKTDTFKPVRIAIAVFALMEEGLTTGESVAAYCREQGASASMFALGDTALSEALVQQSFDMMVVLGGDGTMLRAGHLCACAVTTASRIGDTDRL